MSQGHTPLYAAVLKSAVRITELLITAGANVNVVDYKVRISRQRSLCCMNYKSFCKDGDTPLLASVKGGAVRITELLIAAGANINAVDKVLIWCQ